MQTKQGSTLEGLRAVQQFIVDNEALLGSVGESGTRRRFDEVIKELAAHATAQVMGIAEGKMATQTYHATRVNLLHDHMRAIVAIARAESANVPELRTMRMPRGNCSNTRLVSHAMEMATIASAHEAVFVAAGLSVTFVKDLVAVAGELSDARVRKGDRRTSVGGATSGIKASLATGRSLVAVLDSLIHREIKNAPQLLMTWEAMKRSHHIGRPAAGVMLGQGASIPVLASPEPQRMLAVGETVVDHVEPAL